MRDVVTMADLDALALALPGVERTVTDDGRPAYAVGGKGICHHREPRRDAVDPETGERLVDVLMFRVADLEEKEILLAERPGVCFTTPHFRGYPAVLVRIASPPALGHEGLRDLVVGAWLTRAPRRVARAWLAEHEPDAT